MASRNKSWFFATPPTTAGDRFSKNNIPTEQSYRDLLDSVPNKLEQADTATATQQGLVKLATDAQVMSRLTMGATDFQIAVQPHQLPFIILDHVEADTVNTAITGDGLKATLQEVIVGSVKRYSTKLELEYTNLATGTPAAGDWVTFADINDSNIIKKVAYSSFVTGYWERNTTTIEPVTDNDNLDMGQGTIYGGDIILDESEGVSRYIMPNDNVTGDGVLMIVRGGRSKDPTKDGGKLCLYGGPNDYADGGYVYIASGDANVGGDAGEVRIGYLHTGGAQGRIGLRGAADAVYGTKAYDGIYIASGQLKVLAVVTGTINSMTAWDSANVALAVSAATTNTFLFGAASKGEVLWYNGSAWTRLAIPGADAVLEYNNTTGVVEWGTGGTGTDEKVAVTAGTAGYLEAVLVDDHHGGLSFAVSGSTLLASFKLQDLDITLAPSLNSYAAITIDAGPMTYTRRILLRNLIGGLSSGWTGLLLGTDFTAAPASTSRILTTDLTGYFAKGLPIKYKLNGIANYCYGVINDIAATHVDIAGDPLSAAIEELYIGGKEKVVTKTIQVASATYNASTTESLLEAKANMKEGDRWTDGSAKLVKFEVIHIADDSTQAPMINVRCGLPASITDYVCTSNTTKGIVCSTALGTTVVDIDPTKNDIDYGDNVEIKVDNNSGTGDAQYLTVYLTFVKK